MLDILFYLSANPSILPLHSLEKFEILFVQYYMYIVDVVRISSCIQIFHYNPESIEDIHLAHIEPKTRTPKPLSDPYTNDLFWCGLH